VWLIEFVCYRDVVKKRWLIGLAAAAVVAIVFAVIWPRDHQLEYKGKALSEWLLVLGKPDPDWDAGPQVDEAMAAVRHIGTNGIPFLLKWIQYRPPAWRTNINNALSRLPGNHNFELSEPVRPALGWVGLGILGPDAAPAIPTLDRWMNDPSDFERAAFAMSALREIGQPALPCLLAVLTNSAHPDRGQVALELSFMGEAAKAALPELIRALDSNDKSLVGDVAIALRGFRGQPELVIPALAHSLSKAWPGVRMHAAHSLGEFGQAARPAVPALLKALADPDSGVRQAALAAMERIATEQLSGEL
jgi:hypothetical protein